MEKLSNERINEICKELKNLLFIVEPIKFEEDRKYVLENQILVVIEDKEYDRKDLEKELNIDFSDNDWVELMNKFMNYSNYNSLEIFESFYCTDCDNWYFVLENQYDMDLVENLDLPEEEDLSIEVTNAKGIANFDNNKLYIKTIMEIGIVEE